ncbi:PREDICTED: NADP-dependent malic enzyme [Dipodomys ordii]|uniref:NADP-dependent malic enzyme n=1 Tax=Dipodomys ordii TaxID=10020 RepID=A0A1S3GG79_DIPOR|nr:PREDICTED: NADP-dependent malic enzyme [Dipodomys ordii]
MHVSSSEECSDLEFAGFENKELMIQVGPLNPDDRHKAQSALFASCLSSRLFAFHTLCCSCFSFISLPGMCECVHCLESLPQNQALSCVGAAWHPEESLAYPSLHCVLVPASPPLWPSSHHPGTASVAVAGLLAALRITKNKLADQTILFQGAGEAALGIAHLIVMAMEKEGLPKEKAIRKIWLVDSKGLIVKGRASLTPEKEQFAHAHEEMKSLEAIVQEIKPTALIGVAAIGGAFSEQILKDMAAFNKRPIIFALSNPTSKAECSAEQCYKFTQGRAIFASGSPFDPVTLPSGQTLHPGQGNNSYVFPGVALGVVTCGLKHISDKVFLTTAEVISQQVSDKHLEEGRLYPPLNTIRDVSLKIAVRIVKDAYQEETATVYPEPQNKEAFVRAHMFSPEYDQLLPECYPWPANARKMQTKADL